MAMTPRMRENLGGHEVEREEAYNYAAFQWEIWLTTGSDAEQPKD
jgi:hypothetical protein